MNFNLTGRHIDITPAIRDYVTSKVERAIAHVDNVTSANVIISVEKLKQKAEVTVQVRGKSIFVESDDTDLYAAIDSMADKLDRQIVKYKQKAGDHNHESLKHLPGEEEE